MTVDPRGLKVLANEWNKAVAAAIAGGAKQSVLRDPISKEIIVTLDGVKDEHAPMLELCWFKRHHAESDVFICRTPEPVAIAKQQAANGGRRPEAPKPYITGKDGKRREYRGKGRR